MPLDVIITPEETETWIERSLRRHHPECEAEYRTAWHAFLRCLENRLVESADLATIINAARSKKAVMWESAVEWVRQLASDHTNVQQEIRKIAGDPLAGVRFSALCCVTRRSPRAFQLEMLLPALNDRSSRVRSKAVDVLSRLQISEAIPNIKARRDIEQNLKVKRVIDYELPLLSYGFVAKPVAGGIDLTVKGTGGTVLRFVSQKEIDEHGIPTIVKKAQEKLNEDAIILRYVARQSN